MSLSLPPQRRPQRRQRRLWFERLMAIVALANLGLVIFDLTYVPLRNFWLLGKVKVLGLPVVTVPLPPAPNWCRPLGEQPDRATFFTACYDPVKGIEAYRDTQAYLDTVNQFEQQIQQTGVQSPDAQKLLTNLRNDSNRMVSDNWFEVANKSGTLEKIKDRMRDRIYADNAAITTRIVATDPGTDTAARLAFQEAIRRKAKRSSRVAFDVFWTPQYLSQAGVQRELDWFNTSIRPLMQTNYYRSISENGDFTNQFWILDLPFVILFALEFAARTWYISRRLPSVSWRDAIFWRWYDVPLFFPFGLLFSSWAWVRVLPVAIRLHQSRLVNLEHIRDQATQGFVGSIADDLTEVVIVQVLNQTQQFIRQGEILRWLKQPKREQITVNNVDEIAEMVSLLVKLTVYQVLPKVQPDIEAVLRHNVEGVLNQSPAYQTLKTIPGLSDVPTQLIDRLITEVLQATYSTLTATLEDEKGAALMRQLIQHFTDTLGEEVQERQVTEQLQSLLMDFLEELKLNYVQRSEEVDVENLLEETRQLQRTVKRG